MTYKEAIHILNNLNPTKQYDENDAYYIGQALTMAIQALEQKPWEPILSHSEITGLIYVYFGDNKFEITKQAIEAVKAIKALDQQPCEDAISRQAVETLVDELARAICDERCCVSRGRSTATIMQDILDLPSVNPQEQKTGHWNCGDDMFEYAICSSCKHETGEAWEYAKRNFKYCPNCGAKMENNKR